MTNYRRVTYEDRCQIQAYLQANMSVAEFSRKLGFHKSTIYRDLSRNSYRKKYTALAASKRAKERYLRCRRPYKIHGQLEQVVVGLLFADWSPQQIAVRLRAEGMAVSHETIYQHIQRYGTVLKAGLRRFNKRGAGRYRQRKTKLTLNKLKIGQRPKAAEDRSRIGDWERDTLYVANRKLVLVCTDRKSRYTKLAVTSYRTKDTSKVTWDLLKRYPVRSITNDNGPEFRDGPNMKVSVYYCDPMKPHQRGTVENTIGLLRQYLTRKTDINELTPEKLRSIETAINLRPRRCLDYRTPHEVFYGKSVALAL